MTLPTAEQITNIYLYGQTTTPAYLPDEQWIRPTSYVEKFEVNINDYVAGPGRFVTPGAFTVVERFFEKRGQARIKTQKNLL